MDKAAERVALCLCTNAIYSPGLGFRVYGFRVLGFGFRVQLREPRRHRRKCEDVRESSDGSWVEGGVGLSIGALGRFSGYVQGGIF